MREIGEVLSENLELELIYDWTESVDARAHGPHAAAARECDGMEVLEFPHFVRKDSVESEARRSVAVLGPS